MNTRMPSLLKVVFTNLIIVAVTITILLIKPGKGTAETEYTNLSPITEEEVLKHVSTSKNIPLEQLEVIYNQKGYSKTLDKEFQFYKVEDQLSGMEYGVQVDLSENIIIDDFNEIQSKELALRWAKYGKLDEDLAERINSMGPEDEIPVLIRLAIKEKSNSELYAELASRFPEAQEALKRVGNPFEVGDPKLSLTISNEYVKLIENNIRDQVEPFVDYLKTKGIAAKEFFGFPGVSATLPKEIILETVKREDVAEVSSLENFQSSPLLDIAVPTDRVPLVWAKGIQGRDITIGIVEPGEIDTGTPVTVGSVRVPCGSPSFTQHKTSVANDAASFDYYYKGVAPLATLNDACNDNTANDIIDSLIWAAGNSHVVNSSFTLYGYSNNIQTGDKVYDYWTRNFNRTFVAAAGNDETTWMLGTPAKSYNVITVGGDLDNGTVGLNDDTMLSRSSYVNPVDYYPYDREKPEVVAPSWVVQKCTPTVLCVGDNGQGGTSLAAPQVAGLAALMMNRNSDLINTPNAVKSIILASAMHNIEGDSRLSDKDGAGAIDASIADIVASKRGSEDSTPCSGPCWWNTYITTSGFPTGTYLNRYFQGEAGHKICVAIAWYSFSNCLNLQNCYSDFLSTDLDLHVYGPSGAEITSSVSVNNNFEIVEFTAPATGQYRIGVYRYSLVLPPAGESDNYLGIAWAQSPVYLPDLRNQDGWTTTFYVRNDSTVSQNVTIQYFDVNGNPTPWNFDTCSLSPNQWCWIPVNDGPRIPSGTTGSALIEAGEKISVAAVQHHTSPEAWSVYTGIIAPSTDVYTPLIYKNWYNINSQLYIQNAGSNNASVTVEFKPNSGSSCAQTYSNVPAQGLQIVNLSGISCLGTSFYGAARIHSSAVQGYPRQPLAVTSSTLNMYNGAFSLSEVENGGGPANIVYAPLIQNYNYGWISGSAIQNAYLSPNTLSATFYNQNGSQCQNASYPGVGAYYAYINTVPPGGVCSTVASAVFSGGVYPLEAIVNQMVPNTSSAGDYRAVTTPGQTVVIPLWRNQVNNWTSGMVIQNVNAQTANVTITYYNSGGGLFSTVTTTIQPHAIAAYSNTPGVLEGSVVITADRPVAVIANLANSSGGDGTATYTAVHR